jgi:uncharacterized protein YndB with AHSA1/START domain
MTETALAPVVRAVHVRKPADEAFRIFTERIGEWWPLQRFGLYAAATAGVRFVDGRVVERSTTGEEGVWAEVTDWDPPRRLALSWHPGTDPAVATVVEVDFEPDEDGTRVVLTHSGWEVLGERAEAGRAGYAGGWRSVVAGFADLATGTGSEPGGGHDTSGLRAAYERFRAEAAAGGFGDPADGGWSAAQVVAHVTRNDDLLAEVTRALLDGRPPALDNHDASQADELDRFVAQAGGLPGVLEEAEVSAARLCALLDRLTPEQAATAVPTHIADSGVVVVDEAVPWGAMMTVQEHRHLPMHTDQLVALRRG